MSRLTRILTMTLGSVLLFALFAEAGWAITDRLTSEDQAGQDSVAMLQYPLVPIQGDEESTLDWIQEQQDLTSQAMADPTNPDAFLGDPAAGGQSIRVVPASSLPDTGVAGTVPTTDDEPTDGSGNDGTTEPGNAGTDTSASDEPADGTIPFNIFADAPYLINRIDLSDVIFDGVVGPLDIDICAGSDVLPSTPAGCPEGYGGTIIPLGGDGPTPSVFNAGIRPPTGLTAFGTDLLYVRTFRRSSVPEKVWVAAKELPPGERTPTDLCDTGGALPDPTEGKTVRRPTTTMPIDTSGGPASWPWDPTFDTVDVYGLSLAEATSYAICVYWIDAESEVVSYWEAAMVSTASANRMKVEISKLRTGTADGMKANGDVHFPIKTIITATVASDCYGAANDEPFLWPGTYNNLVPDPPRTLCDFESMSAVLQNGGLPVNVSLVFDDGSVATLDTWIGVDRSDILCRHDCTESFGISVPMPDIDWEPDVPGPIPARFRAGSVRFFVRFGVDESRARQGWFLGEFVSFDMSRRITEAPPLLTRVGELAENRTPYRVREFSFATDRRFRIQNDVPVSVEVELVGVNRDGDLVEPCVAGGLPAPSYRSSAPDVNHFVAMDGLCIGEVYGLRVSAVDEDGVAYDIRDRGYYGDRANLFLFETREWTGPGLTGPVYTVDLVAELELGARPAPETDQRWVFRVGHLELGEYAESPRVEEDIDSESYDAWSESSWRQWRAFPGIVCGSGPSPPLSLVPPLRFELPGVEAREVSNRISQAIGLELLPNLRSCTNTVPVIYEDDLTISAQVSLPQLLEGVTISSGAAEYPRLVVRATSLKVGGDTVWSRTGS